MNILVTIIGFIPLMNLVFIIRRGPDALQLDQASLVKDGFLKLFRLI